MMKTNYEARAIKFAKVLAKRFEGCATYMDFLYAIQEYNGTHIRPLKYESGVSRIVILRADYVIKFDYEPTNSYWIGRAGDCESEEQLYKFAVSEGMEHLLAKTTVLHMNGLTLSIMPRIPKVGLDNRWWGDYCTEEECDWLWRNVGDLHAHNVGYRHGKTCVIDYAWIGD